MLRPLPHLKLIKTIFLGHMLFWVPLVSAVNGLGTAPVEMDNLNNPSRFTNFIC